MATPEQMADTMRGNVPEKTGRTMDDWFGVLGGSGVEKHGEMVKLLKSEHGVSHGFANLIVSDFRNQGVEASADLVATMYETKQDLRPIHDAVVELAEALGGDVVLSPKKAYVSLRRSKQFAMVGPATKTQVEVSFKLKGKGTTDRLQAAKGMATHRVRLSSKDEVDDEIAGWLREAYGNA